MDDFTLGFTVGGLFAALLFGMVLWLRHREAAKFKRELFLMQLGDRQSFDLVSGRLGKERD